jgi:hypothetical protein
MTGIRWFSISSLRKLTKISSAPLIARSTPSCFSLVEKYGEKKKTCRSRFSSSARVNSASCSRISSVRPWADATSQSERA